MKEKLEQIREQLLTLLNKVDKLIEGGDDVKVKAARPIDPPPPDKPKHP